jgi:predicted transport protein
MDQATQTMIDNLHRNTGKSMAEWVAVLQSQALSKHGERVKYLKEVHGFTHGFANLVAHSANQSADPAAKQPDSLLEQQYQGKEHFRPLYERLLQKITTFGADVEVAPKNAYVSLRRKKQFALLQPATKTRFEIGLNLKGETPTERLQAEKPTAMCSHKIMLSSINDLDEEVFTWLKKAYERAG